jgi:SAM-dependent methyltransferase
MMHGESDLATIYDQRFKGRQNYRNRVWRVLIDDFMQTYVPRDAAVLDIGCGYGEFINNVRCRVKFGMDMNPDTAKLLSADVQFLQQDCSTTWNLPEASLDVIFTSNFFEHLPSKQALALTLKQAFRSLNPGGKLIALGPNIKFLPGAYWDFWDHYLPLTEISLEEGLKIHGFEVVRCIDRFLPYTMARGVQYPILFLKLYLKIPFVWRIWGKQFFLVAQRPGARLDSGGNRPPTARGLHAMF